MTSRRTVLEKNDCDLYSVEKESVHLAIGLQHRVSQYRTVKLAVFSSCHFVMRELFFTACDRRRYSLWAQLVASHQIVKCLPFARPR